MMFYATNQELVRVSGNAILYNGLGFRMSFKNSKPFSLKLMILKSISPK